MSNQACVAFARAAGGLLLGGEPRRAVSCPTPFCHSLSFRRRRLAASSPAAFRVWRASANNPSASTPPANNLPPGFPQDVPMPPPGKEAPNSWKPEGLLREAVGVKEVEMELIASTILERPDHPTQLRMSFYESNPTLRFAKALRRDDGTLAVVAALKRFQPRHDAPKPELVADLNDIGRDGRRLELAGVDAAFVNTDTMRFGCDLAEITAISNAVAKTSEERGLPLSRQDLIINPIQIAEAAVAGASAVTICAAAALPELLELLNAATAMGVEAIVECHTELERDLAIECGAMMLYFTNRDRSTNIVYPGTAERLRVDIPAWIVTMGGGELRTARDAWSLLDAGFDAVVLGETLLKSRRAADFIREIRSEKRLSSLDNPFQRDFT